MHERLGGHGGTVLIALVSPSSYKEMAVRETFDLTFQAPITPLLS